jgi:hypothetical protein
MRESRSSGSVEGVVSNHDPYSDFRSRQVLISIPVGRDYLHANPSSGPKLPYDPNTILYTGNRTWLLLSMAATRQDCGISGFGTII